MRGGTKSNGRKQDSGRGRKAKIRGSANCESQQKTITDIEKGSTGEKNNSDVVIILSDMNRKIDDIITKICRSPVPSAEVKDQMRSTICLNAVRHDCNRITDSTDNNIPISVEEVAKSEPLAPEPSAPVIRRIPRGRDGRSTKVDGESILEERQNLCNSQFHSSSNGSDRPKSEETPLSLCSKPAENVIYARPKVCKNRQNLTTSSAVDVIDARPKIPSRNFRKTSKSPHQPIPLLLTPIPSPRSTCSTENRLVPNIYKPPQPQNLRVCLPPRRFSRVSHLDKKVPPPPYPPPPSLSSAVHGAHAALSSPTVGKGVIPPVPKPRPSIHHQQNEIEVNMHNPVAQTAFASRPSNSQSETEGIDRNKKSRSSNKARARSKHVIPLIQAEHSRAIAKARTLNAVSRLMPSSVNHSDLCQPISTSVATTSTSFACEGTKIRNQKLANAGLPMHVVVYKALADIDKKLDIILASTTTGQTADIDINWSI